MNRHGRDNKLHVWRRIKDASQNVEALGGSAASPQGIPVPELIYSLDVNALNFCPFSMLGVSYNYNTGWDEELFVGVPNLVESCWVRHRSTLPGDQEESTLMIERQTFGHSHLVSASTLP